MNTKKFKKLINYIFQKEVLLIYQMGKVGSTSLEKSLENNNKYYTEHTHSLRAPIVFKMFKNFKSIKFYAPLKFIIIYKIGALIKKFIIKRKKIKIITLVREPISRNISMYFQDIHIPIFDVSILNDNRHEDKVNHTILHDFYFKKFNHYYGVNWMEEEISKNFGINVYEHDFNKEKGYGVITKGNVSILILKMEKLNDLKSEIQDFLCLKDLEIKKSNQAKEKWYAPLYKQFMENFHPSEDYINELYNTKYMSHFYTKQEIETYINKWKK
ncbi:putative capsular polysaccharide synthesis family protein [Mangrovibacillus sp. Mu-81]|uniref:putative capsular polysaccharide synthesis family protein n=1 Tax=Mangrovibacillus sp. Mu-81 TaxID=3121478 RepID=UPI002FE4A954